MSGDRRSHPYGVEMSKAIPIHLNTIDETYGVTLEWEARFCILGYRREVGERKSTTVAILRCLFQAREIIVMRWQSRTPQVVRDWIIVIN